MHELKTKLIQDFQALGEDCGLEDGYTVEEAQDFVNAAQEIFGAYELPIFLHMEWGRGYSELHMGVRQCQTVQHLSEVEIPYIDDGEMPIIDKIEVFVQRALDLVTSGS